LESGLIAIAAPSIVAMLAAVLFVAAIALGALAWNASGELIYPTRRAAVCSPADYGLKSEEISFRSKDGPELRGWWIPTALPAKGTIILSHGYTGDCSPDLVYAPLLNSAGYNVCLFDYRGHGSSDGNYTSLVYYERRDLLAALDFLRSRGITRVGLIGFSMGGAIALATAPHSSMVVGVVSDCTFGELTAILQNAALRRGIPGLLSRPIAWLVMLFASLRLRTNLFASDPIRWVAKIAPRPVLIMHGEDDEDIPKEQALRLFSAAQEPKQLWIVPGAKHRRIEEIAGEEYRRRVIEFFDGAFAAAPPTP
jgi:alpha-beta hydrolase superfamily lysophospholipase